MMNRIWQSTLALLSCTMFGQSCDAEVVPTAATIQAAYEREATPANGRHDKGLRVIEAKCDDGAGGSFLCQVTFLSVDDPEERLYFDVVAVARAGRDWELRSGLCKR
jgi:hypothetical protein